MNIKRALPWQAKIAAKIILSRVPLGYRFWQRFNLFKHGGMEEPEYAHAVFTAQFNRTHLSNKSAGFTSMELGPGDTLVSALVAMVNGASRCYLMDEGRTPSFWEREFMVRSGFYTNRICYGEMLRGFAEAGFDVEVLRTERFATLPTPRKSLAPEYRRLPEDDLLVSSFDVVLRPST